MIRRLYRSLLRLLPFEFRAEYGRDMEQAFADEEGDVRARRNVTEILDFWLRTVRDFARTAPQQHWDILWQDMRVGVRLLTRNPGFAATAILTLALGIGGSTSIFSVVYAVVLRPLDFPESERVVRIGWAKTGEDMPNGLRPLSYSHLQTLRDKATSFDLIGGTRYDSLRSDRGSLEILLPHSGVIGAGQPFRGPVMASPSLFRIFGASTVLGRLPTEQDEQPGATPTAVISYGTWTKLYGRDPAVIGQTLARFVGGGQKKSVTITGVLSADALEYPYGENERTPAWGLFDPDVTRMRDDNGREQFNVGTYARLAPGVSLEAARAELAALSPPLRSDLPDFMASANAALQAVRLRDEIVRKMRTPLLAFLGAVSCLLLVASGNVASLMLARTMSRRQEFAARLAIGARPLRIARQLLTESAILTLSGGLLGVGLAWAARRAFIAISPPMPRLSDSAIGAPALAFALCGVLLATCVIGLMPALQASRRSVLDGLRRAGGAGASSTAFSRPLAVLAAAEVAIVLVLLAGTGLLVNSFARLVFFDLGFDTATIAASVERNVTVPTPPRAAPAAKGRQTVAVLSERSRLLRAIDDEIVDRVSAIPGVVAAALTGDVPFGPASRAGADVRIGDAPATSPVLRIGGPGTLKALGMRMAAGRWFEPGDREGTPLVAVVNETMRKSWAERSPLGDHIVFGNRVLQVVGVVRDVRDQGARSDVRPTLYLSRTQFPPYPAALVVRGRPGAIGLERAIAAELARMGDRVKAGGPTRLETFWWRQLADTRFLTTILSVFTTLALAVAIVGVHGIVRFIVAHRMREMGIRKALGATPGSVVRLVVGQALRFAVPGLVVGLLGARLTGPALRSLLFGITPADPLTLLAAIALLLAAVIAGAYFPARRASAVDPALSLRAE